MLWEIELFHKVKEPTYQEATAKYYAPNDKASKSRKQKVIKLQEDIIKFTNIFGVFNTHL